MAKKVGPLNVFAGGLQQFGQSARERARGNPRVSLISLTAAGMAKAKQYGMDGKEGDILTYLARSQPATADEIHMRTGIELHTVQNVIEHLCSTKPPLAVIGGGQS